ncbi:MAG: type II toxin-antitoxin system prevent-host-death family antitoxin [Gemmatimonadales bacterium]|nr:type II toxin-antitoxin system prevent-host-death family antitoxin [Gemmatimonadales bacterium]
MRTVGVRELKAHLSRVLREVQAGEPVLITDRGRVVAELRRPGAAAAASDPLDRALARLATEGHLRLAERSPDPYPASPLKAQPGAARALIDAERGER